MDEITVAQPTPEEMVEFDQDFLKDLEDLAQGRYGPDDNEYQEVGRDKSWTVKEVQN